MWWSTAIMGGMEPRQCFERIDTNIIRLKSTDDVDQNNTEKSMVEIRQYNKRQVESNIDSLIKFVGDQTEFDAAICGQVLGVVVMMYGCTMNSQLRQLLIDSAMRDPWPADDNDRMATIARYIELVNNYPEYGVAIPVHEFDDPISEIELLVDLLNQMSEDDDITLQ